MAAWDTVCSCRRLLVFLARGFCACSLALLYLFVGLALCSGGRTVQAAQPSHLQESLGTGSTRPSSSSTSEKKLSVVLETTLVGSDAPPLNTHHHPCFSGGQTLVASTQERIGPMIIPEIIVQDFSAEDGLIRYKTPKYYLTDSLKRRRRSSRARSSITLEDHAAFGTRLSPFRPPTLGAPPIGGLRPLRLTDSREHQPSDVIARNLVGFTSRKRAFGDVVAKDGSFVIVGL